MLVRRTYLNHCNVAWKSSAAVKLLGLAKEYRNIVCISCLNSLADISSHEECLVEEYAVVFRV